MKFFKFIIFPIIFFNIYYAFAADNLEKNNINLKLENDLIGSNKYYTTIHEDTLITIARKYGISFADILSANGDMDPWIPGSNKNLLIPKEHILPFGNREGIIINIGDLRLYYFKNNKIIKTFPIGIGRSGWETPLGKTMIIEKKENPIWIPPESLKIEDPELPDVVGPGPENPLGTRALYLSMPAYLLHGTNKPYGVGMKVSHGCIRLYPEHIEELYELVTINTKVNIIDQPIKAGWKNNQLFIEVHKLPKYVRENSQNLTTNNNLLPLAYEIVQKAAALDILIVDWKKVKLAVNEAKGIPTIISK
tara:strand:+ start:251 stop:1171 length:921 start_codon:yes stop_codon:yes gene_type:complete